MDRLTPFQCTPVYSPTSRLDNTFTRTSLTKPFATDKRFVLVGTHQRECGSDGEWRVHIRWSFLLSPQYRLPSCHLFFFLSYFNILAYDHLRPYGITEFYYMLSWIYSALETPPSWILITVRATSGRRLSLSHKTGVKLMHLIFERVLRQKPGREIGNRIEPLRISVSVNYMRNDITRLLKQD